MQREILENSSSTSLRVYAVWVPFLGGTKDSADLSRRVLPDPRVTQFWDGSELTSRWFAENVEHSAVPAWDVYYLYGPDATWTGAPEPLVGSGGSIIGRSSELEQAIGALLQPAPA